MEQLDHMPASGKDHDQQRHLRLHLHLNSDNPKSLPDPPSANDDKNLNHEGHALLPPSYGLHHTQSHTQSHPQSHDPDSLFFPEVPSTELPPLAPIQNLDGRPHSHDQASEHVLPSITRLTESLPSTSASPPENQDQRLSPPRLSPWPCLNPLTVYYTPSYAQAADSPGKMDVEMSGTRAGSVSLDDPDVRMAAEALGDLRADFVSTTPQHHPQQQQYLDPEPLLQLLTTSHPLLAKTIEGTTSAYNTSKNFSPRFKSGAEYVEGYLTPIGNTLGSVGRVTGVEGGVRWFLKGSRRQASSSDLESGDGARNKRRRMAHGSPRESRGAAGPDHGERPEFEGGLSADFDPYAFTKKDRRASMSTVDTLPAYDEHRSPAYTEAAADERSHLASTPVAGADAPWQSRLIMSTSGLSIAMSEESLRSLKYCLQWLRWANNHIGTIIGALKATLEQYEKHPNNKSGSPPSSAEHQQLLSGPDAMAVDEPNSPGSEEQAHSQAHPQTQEDQELGQRIAVLKSDVLKTLRAVIETVSKYAGGALPENARVLVRRHLTSLPQRFRLASQAEPSSSSSTDSQANEKEVREGAQRVLLLAQEGLDMMAQVSGVLDGTIVSAEEWCARLGKRKQEERESLTQQHLEPLTGVGIDGDVKMG